MAQSPEYPQYRWMPPRSWSAGRPSGPPRWIVIHTTEGSEGPRSAEDGAAYDQRRTDGTSAHFYVDSNSVVQCVRTTDRAHTAGYHGNLWGIHIEVCGLAGQSAAQWDDPVSRATIEQTAGLCRVLRQRYPFPLVDLTPAQVRAGTARGFAEHYDVTRAWGESTHTDPGPRFPWRRMFDLIEEDDMPTAAEIAAEVVKRLDTAPIRGGRTLGGSLDALCQTDGAKNPAAKAVWATRWPNPAKPGTTTAMGDYVNWTDMHVQRILNAVAQVDEEVLARIGPDRTPEEIAALLAPLLGGQAAAVGQALAALAAAEPAGA